MDVELELPKGWRWEKLGALVDNPKQDLVDGPFGSNLKADEYIEKGIPVFKIQNIKVNRFADKKISFISEEKAQTLIRHSFKAGDLIITKLGEPLGLCCKVPAKYPFGIIVADLMRLRPSKSKVYDQFLVYAINSEVVQSQFKAITKGTTRARVNLSIVRDIEIPLPSLPKQEQLVEKIEQLFSELDKGIENLKTAQQQLKVYRQAVLKWAFEGKLTNENVKDGELPEGWETQTLKEIGRVLSGFAFKSTDFTTKGLPIIKIANVGYSEFVWKDQQFAPESFLKSNENYKIFHNDILIALTRPITNNTTKICRYPKDAKVGLLNQRVACIKQLSINSDYLFWYFQTNTFKNYIRSHFSETLQPNLSPKDLELTPIPICSAVEQEKIIQEIASRLSVCDKVEETISSSLQQAEALRQSILKRAFEGKLVKN